MAAICRAQSLTGYQDNINLREFSLVDGPRVGWTDQVPNEEEPQGWELEQTNGRITQVKPDERFDNIAVAE